MQRIVLAASAYFAGVFALGFVLGAVRVLWVAPAVGEWAATLVELPPMLAAAWAWCGFLLRRFAVPATLAARLAMGALAFALLMLAEIALGVALFGRGLPEQVAAMTGGAGLAGLIGQALFAALPLARLRQGES